MEAYGGGVEGLILFHDEDYKGRRGGGAHGVDCDFHDENHKDGMPIPQCTIICRKLELGLCTMCYVL